MNENEEENKLLYLRKNYGNTDWCNVTWKAMHIPKINKYVYFLEIKLNYVNKICLSKHSTNYNYLIDLYNLFMQEK